MKEPPNTRASPVSGTGGRETENTADGEGKQESFLEAPSLWNQIFLSHRD